MTSRKFKLNSPVLFLVFNRLDSTSKVFESIREAKPPRLYISSDGHRESNILEKKKVQEIRDYLINNIDWDCEVQTLFHSSNQGCKTAVYKAITWFFENEEMGIILEDDCLPNKDFFEFCDSLLHKYINDNRVFSISGRNHLDLWKNDEMDYFFSTGSIWGWATWKRAWDYIDIELTDFNDLNHARESLLWLEKKCKLKADEIYLGCVNSKIGKNSSWAYPWAYARIKNKSLNIVPTKNLVKNIGFNYDSTHTNFVYNAEPNQHDLSFPLEINKSCQIDFEYINKCSNQNKPSLYKRIRIKILNFFK